MMECISTDSLEFCFLEDTLRSEAVAPEIRRAIQAAPDVDS